MAKMSEFDEASLREEEELELTRTQGGAGRPASSRQAVAPSQGSPRAADAEVDKMTTEEKVARARKSGMNVGEIERIKMKL